jgi:hypothetical protein
VNTQRPPPCANEILKREKFPKGQNAADGCEDIEAMRSFNQAINPLEVQNFAPTSLNHFHQVSQGKKSQVPMVVKTTFPIRPTAFENELAESIEVSDIRNAYDEFSLGMQKRHRSLQKRPGVSKVFENIGENNDMEVLRRKMIVQVQGFGITVQNLIKPPSGDVTHPRIHFYANHFPGSPTRPEPRAECTVAAPDVEHSLGTPGNQIQNLGPAPCVRGVEARGAFFRAILT